MQNVHSKQWTDEKTLAERKTTGLRQPTAAETKAEREKVGLLGEDKRRPTVDNSGNGGIINLPSEIAKEPSLLSQYTPEELRANLEKAGFEIKPLKQGKYKDIPFENGGGFKVNFGDGGLLQYHPEKGSHHDGAYYKISTGKKGIHRYELDGTEKTT